MKEYRVGHKSQFENTIWKYVPLFEEHRASIRNMQVKGDRVQ